MKTINRMALGTISSFLLSAGLTHAAQKLDPLTNSIGKLNLQSNANEGSSQTCALPCFVETD
jgi:hypothetical protein